MLYLLREALEMGRIPGVSHGSRETANSPKGLTRPSFPVLLFVAPFPNHIWDRTESCLWHRCSSLLIVLCINARWWASLNSV